MRTTFRAFILASAVLAAAAFTTQHASAEALRVPFDFTLNGKVMPAGVYQVQRDALKDFVSLHGPQRNHLFTWLLVPGDGSPSSNQVKMIFTRHGSEYSLHTVQYHASTTCILDKKQIKDDAERASVVISSAE